MGIPFFSVEILFHRYKSHFTVTNRISLLQIAFFFPDKNSLKKTYDFIVCSEAAEHFHQPAKEFKKFNSLLNENGWIGIMTNFQTENARFKNWHYRRDPTHVVFYRKETFEVIGKQFRWAAYFPSRNVVIFQKI